MGASFRMLLSYRFPRLPRRFRQRFRRFLSVCRITVDTVLTKDIRRLVKHLREHIAVIVFINRPITFPLFPRPLLSPKT